MSTFTTDPGLSLSMTNQEGLDRTITVNRVDSNGDVIGPYDFTNTTITAQVKRSRKIADTPIATLTVTKTDAANGVLRLTLTKTQAEAMPVSPTTGATPYWYWDFNVAEPGSERDCLWIAPFVVEAGVSQ
jgi:hypothetical protein